MNMNGHADEHGRKKREHVRLNQHDDHFEPGDADRKRYRHREADAESRNGAAEQFREDEDERHKASS